MSRYFERVTTAGAWRFRIERSGPRAYYVLATNTDAGRTRSHGPYASAGDAQTIIDNTIRTIQAQRAANV